MNDWQRLLIEESAERFARLVTEGFAGVEDVDNQHTPARDTLAIYMKDGSMFVVQITGYAAPGTLHPNEKGNQG